MINPQMILQMLPQLQNNPVGMAMQSGFNIPQGQNFNGPQQLVNYLINSGQVNQNTLNQAQSIAQQMGYKL